MKIRNWKNPIVWLVMLLVSGCVDPYFPEVKESGSSFLVVNGFLNANGPTTIQLLRSQSLNDTEAPPAEENATVIVESENGERFGLHGTGYGTYRHPNLQLRADSKYRLYIRTRSGSEYASDYVEVKTSPAIESVNWKAEGGEVKIYVNSQDPNNSTHYYKWDYEETWQFRSALYSVLIYENGQVRFREPSDVPIAYCWKSDNSTRVEIGSSVKLSEDRISNYRILSIPYNSEKISMKYSILVKQYALTREAFEYLEMLKKNTENIGTLFDPLPSQLTSNIRSLSNPDETVIGYISATTMETKRIFVSSRDLPRDWRLYYPSCEVDTVMISSGQVQERFTGGYLIPVDEIYSPTSPVAIGYTYGTRACVDCTLQGTNVKPAYWE
ncbi:DUF4249 domain-containing protein [Pontibacter amylolyticus]|uniref:DUF4249 domain-containing protein n=1 Tax=Pontibacter amylolyticus TaxID=1424080 RepID=A0ABQ1VZA1_9BACT|nr:DUF4249 domain-containing protein [Pontibacter amylolyticus]GGG06941.1 hypothetical protein GCM10011323_09540 [Pontibacter amylolyticus]